MIQKISLSRVTKCNILQDHYEEGKSKSEIRTDQQSQQKKSRSFNRRHESLRGGCRSKKPNIFVQVIDQFKKDLFGDK